MTRRRHGSDSIKRARSLQRERRMVEDLRFLSKRGKRPDPTNYRAVTRAARELRNREALEENYSRRVPKRQRETLKARGFHTTKTAVVIDSPRDSRRRKIKGAKMDVLKDGTIKWTVGERRDFIYGMTKKEKKEFARDPELFTQKILKRLREKNPSLRKVKPSRIQKRLQWGAFQATKDFAPSYFTKQYFASISPEDETKGRRTKRLDKLTGLHFVIHIPKPRKQKRGANVKRKKRK